MLSVLLAVMALEVLVLGLALWVQSRRLRRLEGRVRRLEGAVAVPLRDQVYEDRQAYIRIVGREHPAVAPVFDGGEVRA
jgi:hypothetical protein